MTRTWFTLIAIVLVSGCSKHLGTAMDQYIKTDFADLKPASFASKNTFGAGKQLPHASLDEAWIASLIVASQSAVIIRSDRAPGFIFAIPKGIPCVPFIIWLNDTTPPSLKWQWVPEMYAVEGRASGTQSPCVSLQPQQIEDYSKTTLDQIATQTYAGKKWNFLYGSQEAGPE